MKKSNQFFKLNYDIDKLEVFSQSLHKSIEGALGLYFLNEKRNLLYECCILIYRKYLKELLNRIDYFYDIDSELEPEDRVKFIDEISYIKKFISSVLFSIHYILSKIENKDIIDFCYITLRLADLCEGMDNIDTGVEVLHQTIEYVYNYKEEQNKFGLDNDQNPHSFNTFTCDNNKIVNLENTINEKLENHVRGLNFKRRQQVSKLSKYI